MSGTSLDGLDGVLAHFDGPLSRPTLTVLSRASQPFPASLRAELMALNSAGPDELHRAALAANAMAEIAAGVVQMLLREAGSARTQVAAVGLHGQTVRHRPSAFDGTGYTLQLHNASLLAERCGIDVVCDFRSRDVAAGGQGAPLVPAFHEALFAQRNTDVAVLNIGGIANLSLLPGDGGTVLGFDTGPGNALMDAWCLQHTGAPLDRDGAWAASGRVHEALLAEWLAEPYFAQAPPKSTGRDLFSPAWLSASLERVGRQGGSTAAMLKPEDVQATLTELTARSIAEALARHQPRTAELLVCGGGALNRHLMRRLGAHLSTWATPPSLHTTERRGLPVMEVEAAAFAWLAACFLERLPANRPAVTGARGPRVLGALYPA